MPSDVERFRAARELIARPGGWTQGAWAIHDGKKIKYIEDVCDGLQCYCALGALLAKGSTTMWLAKAIDNHIIDWNDAKGRTQAEVVSAFDRAIALAEAAHV